MFSIFTAKILAWICAGLLAALLLTGAFAGCEHRNAKQARAARDAVTAELSEATSANAEQLKTIETQSQALASWRSLGVTVDEAAAAVTSMNAYGETLKSIDEEFRKAKEKDRAIPDCAALLRVDLERVCPGIARSLRDSASGDQDGRRRSSRAGREAAP
jgi:hypothetical protein